MEEDGLRPSGQPQGALRGRDTARLLNTKQLTYFPQKNTLEREARSTFLLLHLHIS